jgi:hypothetical protein
MAEHEPGPDDPTVQLYVKRDDAEVPTLPLELRPDAATAGDVAGFDPEATAPLPDAPASDDPTEPIPLPGRHRAPQQVGDAADVFAASFGDRRLTRSANVPEPVRVRAGSLPKRGDAAAARETSSGGNRTAAEIALIQAVRGASWEELVALLHSEATGDLGAAWRACYEENPHSEVLRHAVEHARIEEGMTSIRVPGHIRAAHLWFYNASPAERVEYVRQGAAALSPSLRDEALRSYESDPATSPLEEMSRLALRYYLQHAPSANPDAPSNLGAK